VSDYEIRPVGYVESPLTDRESAPKQGFEGAPDAWLVFDPEVAHALRDLAVGADALVLTWLHRARRDVLAVHPRDDPRNPETGVFSTRSQDRPNPIGLHRVKVAAIDGLRVLVRDLEAFDGTPIVDVKPVLRGEEAGAAMTPAPPRTAQRRKRDALDLLERDIDAWVASADPGDGTPYLVPLSFLWDGEHILLATPSSSPTGRNLQATGRVRLGIGPTRDLVLIEATVQAPVAAGEVPDEVGDAFAAKTGFDPRQLTGYLYFRLHPQRLQAWREANELEGRDLMRDGRWLVP
jgi:tRNA-Thr(GGU) m(6)t(6)A37 methyltransferase TsaA